MKPAFRSWLVLVVMIALAGCRQADGPIPMPRGEDQNRIDDLSRNLENIARGDPDGPRDLADDLLTMTSDGEEPQRLVAELAQRTVPLVAGRSLSEDASQALGRQLWMTVAARELSERQIEQLQTEVRGTLTALGGTEAQVEPVVTLVGEVQRAVTLRPRRWYQLF
jgi:hypothetical protein